MLELFFSTSEWQLSSAVVNDSASELSLDVEWVLLSDSENVRESTLWPRISETDYELLLQQFPFSDFCEFLVSHVVKITAPDALMTLMALCNRVLSVVSNAPSAFPVRPFRQLVKRCVLLLPLHITVVLTYPQDRSTHYGAVKVHRKVRRIEPAHWSLEADSA